MRLGIDFGTTRTAVAAADRGNYPVVGFLSEDGEVQQWYPSLIACSSEGELGFGLAARKRQGDRDWTTVRSIKRGLGSLGLDSLVEIRGCRFPIIDLLTGYLHCLMEDLRTRSNLVGSERNEEFEAFVAVPANANSNQRFLTLEAFRRAGFKVLGMVNEPSAAGIEFAHRYSKRQSPRRDQVVMYDLGGGTFDASVISSRGQDHEVLANEGIACLGGDDFDEILARLVIQRVGLMPTEPREMFLLLEACREAKERLNPNTRKVTVETASIFPDVEEVSVPVTEFYDACRPLVDRTIEAVESAVTRAMGGEDPWAPVSALYLVGGSSDLPAVARTLRERYGRKVIRSPYPYAATAIGLAIAVDQMSGSVRTRDRLARHFGVWREAEWGTRAIFDPIFEKDLRLPGAGDPPLRLRRKYRPAHNVGCFRYLECGRIGPDGDPSGDVSPWDPVLFPFDHALQGTEGWERSEVVRDPGVEQADIEEVYTCDDKGIIQARIEDKTTGFSMTYTLKRGR